MFTSLVGLTVSAYQGYIYYVALTEHIFTMPRKRRPRPGIRAKPVAIVTKHLTRKTK